MVRKGDWLGAQRSGRRAPRPATGGTDEALGVLADDDHVDRLAGRAKDLSEVRGSSVDQRGPLWHAGDAWRARRRTDLTGRMLA